MTDTTNPENLTVAEAKERADQAWARYREVRDKVAHEKKNVIKSGAHRSSIARLLATKSEASAKAKARAQEAQNVYRRLRDEANY
ncbi:hypothetical protein [Nocardioides sp. HB32]